MPIQIPNFARLLPVLNNTGLAAEKNNLYQYLKELLNLIIQFAKAVADLLNDQESKNTVLSQATYLTSTDQSAILPFSRNVLAGTGISFDDSVANERTINATGAGGYMPVNVGNVFMTIGDGNPLVIPYEP